MLICLSAVLDFWKNCKGNTELPSTPQPVFPLLTSSGAVVLLSVTNTETLLLAEAHSSRRFPQFSPMPFLCPWVPCDIQSTRLLQLLWAETVSRIFLVLMVVLRQTGLGFFRMPFRWVSPGVFSQWDPAGRCQGTTEVKRPPRHTACRAHAFSVDFPCDVGLGHLAEVAAARWLLSSPSHAVPFERKRACTAHT